MASGKVFDGIGKCWAWQELASGGQPTYECAHDLAASKLLHTQSSRVGKTTSVCLTGAADFTIMTAICITLKVYIYIYRYNGASALWILCLPGHTAL